jgi:hypothetical protein
MSDRSSIEWTDATWNPIRARFAPMLRPQLGRTFGFEKRADA